jgi:branched-chain amino acid transport system substrate-binding protein
MRRGFSITIALAAAWMCLSAVTARADIHIATAGPVTGPLASLGEQMLMGARRAVADINARGGVLGRKLVLHVEDDQCDPRQAVAVANRLAAQGVAFVAGHFCSGASIPASKVYGEEGVIMISPASTSPKLTDEGGPYIFRVCGRDDYQGGMLGRYIADRHHRARVAILHDQTAYGKGLAEETRRAMVDGGPHAVLFEGYTAGEKDFSALVSRLKAARIEVVFIGGYHTEAGLILRQMREQGLDAQLIGGDTLVTREFWSIAGEAGEGTLFSFAPDARRYQAAERLVSQYRAEGQEPAGYVLYTYAAIEAWAYAAEQAGSTQAEAVSKALQSQEFYTAIGLFRFNSRGDANLPPYAVYRWSAGTYEQIPGEW